MGMRREDRKEEKVKEARKKRSKAQGRQEKGGSVWMRSEGEREGRGRRHPPIPEPCPWIPTSPSPRKEIQRPLHMCWVISTCFIPAIKIIKNISNYYTHTK